MTVDSVDQRLVAWAERLQRTDDSLLALEAEPTYRVLAATAGPAPLDGATAARVSPALAGLAEFHADRARLILELDRAKAIRASTAALAFWEANEKLAEIDKLLDGAPEQLLAAMIRAFDRARDAVAAVTHAWATLEPAIARAERDTSELRRIADTLGHAAATSAELASLEHAVATLRAGIARDPLGVTGTIEQALAPRIAAVRTRLDAELAIRKP